MYIRLKIYDKKSYDKFQKPIFLQTVEGLNAIELLFISISKQYFGSKFADEIKEVFDKRRN